MTHRIIFAPLRFVMSVYFRRVEVVVIVFFFNDTATTEIYTLSLHDALPISLPTILSSFASSLKDLRDSRLGQAVTRLRTEDDLPISLTVGGSIALAIVLTLLPQVGVNLLGAVLIVIFGFFFATVSSRVTGQIGSSANPISGMT